MSGVGKRRARKEARRYAPVSARNSSTTAAPLKVVQGGKPPRHKTGIEWLASKGRINRRQVRAGERYGLHFRLAEVEGAQPIRSCLGSEGQPRGGGLVLAAAVASIETEARSDLQAARAALSFHAGMIAACDAVCGRGLTPWEAVEQMGGRRKEFEQMEAALLIALELLAKFYEA